MATHLFKRLLLLFTLIQQTFTVYLAEAKDSARLVFLQKAYSRGDCHVIIANVLCTFHMPEFYLVCFIHYLIQPLQLPRGLYSLIIPIM